MATVREARKTNEPDPVWAATLAELGGADGITIHLREDRRHIQDRDLRALMESARYPYVGSLERNVLLPTAVGALRPAALMPATMAAGDMRLGGPVLLAGFRELRDFFPPLAAANLAAQGVPARGIYLKLPPTKRKLDFYTRTVAQLFDDPAFRASDAVKAALADRIV